MFILLYVVEKRKNKNYYIDFIIRLMITFNLIICYLNIKYIDKKFLIIWYMLIVLIPHLSWWSWSNKYHILNFVFIIPQLCRSFPLKYCIFVYLHLKFYIHKCHTILKNFKYKSLACNACANFIFFCRKEAKLIIKN